MNAESAPQGALADPAGKLESESKVTSSLRRSRLAEYVADRKRVLVDVAALAAMAVTS